MEADIFPDAPEYGKSARGGEWWLTVWMFSVAAAVAGLVILFKSQTLPPETDAYTPPALSGGTKAADAPRFRTDGKNDPADIAQK